MLGLGELAISREPGSILKAMALGSCVAVVAVAPRYRAVGMIHVVLPDSKIDAEKGTIQPGYFADTGIPALLAQFRSAGVLNMRDLVIKLAGGAKVMAGNATFDIGKRNILACRKALWQNKMAPLGEDVGSNFSRTVWVAVDTGRVFVDSPGKGRWEL